MMSKPWMSAGGKEGAGRRTSRESGEKTLERAGAADMPEAGQRLFLDLADPFPRDAEHAADLLQRHGLGAVEPEVEPQHLGFAFLEGGQHFLDGLGKRVLEGLGIRSRVLGIGQIVEELVVLTGRVPC